MKTTIGHNVKKLAAVLLLALLVSSLAGCGSRVSMPFNGDIVFYELTAEIPADFIRDSTQSHENLWIFEKDSYSQYILVTRSDVSGDPIAGLEDYALYLKEQGVNAQRVTFGEMEAVQSAYTREGVFCQEMLFAYNGSFYAVALRGGTEAEFSALLDSVAVSE